MPFGVLTLGSATFNPRKEGHYVESTVAFGDPNNYLVVRPVSFNKDVARIAISRVLEKDVTVGSAELRQMATVTMTINATVNFTAAELDALAADLSSFITSDTLSRVLQGEI